MKKTTIAIAAIVLLTSAYYQRGGPEPGGTWTFKSNHYRANSFMRHRESTAIFDTTQKPHPKFIVDFYRNAGPASGTYRVIRERPLAADEISIGVGIINGAGLTFYSTTGGNGKETVNVIVSEGKMKISCTGIELANQNDPKDTAPLSFDITIEQ
jgi:hypothetical protein